MFLQKASKYGSFEISEFHKGKLGKYVRVRRDKVFVTIVPDCLIEVLMPVIKEIILESSTIYMDGWKVYDCLVLNGIEKFWSFAKRQFAKLNGCTSDKFVLYLKECEWHYNYRNDDLLTLLKRLYMKTYLD